MKRFFTNKYLLLGLFSGFLILFTISCHSKVIPQKPVNINVLNYSDFYLNTESVGQTTFTRGSLFVSADESHPEKRRLQIIGWIEVDPEDLGGIRFRLPIGWTATSVVSDFPQGKPDPSDYIVLDAIVDEGKYRQSINIGGAAVWAIYSGGGKGNISIDIEPLESQSAYMDAEKFELTIGAGSINGSTLTIFPCYSAITVPLNVDRRTPSPSKTDK